MRILFLLNQNVYPHVIGGMELFNHHLIEELAKRHEIEVASTHSTKSNEKDNIDWFKIKKLWPSVILTPIQYILLLLRKSKKYDIVILPFATYGGWYIWTYYIFFLPISFFLKKRLLIVIHSGVEKKCKPYWVYEKIFKNSTLVGVGNRISEFYRECYKTEVHYIPSIIPLKKSIYSKDELREMLGFSQKDTLFLYVGSFRKIKNVGFIINSLIILGNAYLNEKNIKLILIGDGETREENEKLVRASDMSKYIIFLGNKTKEDVADYYRLCDALVMASSYESLGQTLIEALFNELLLIASKAVAYNAFLNEDNALLFNPNDYNSLIQHIKYFVENRDSNGKLISNAKNTYFGNFVYEDMIYSYELLFEKIQNKNSKFI